MSCYHDDQGWWVAGRHEEHPEDWEGDCPSCQPCTERHCRCKTHLTGTDQMCPKCIGHIREDLRDIEDRTALMLPEAIYRGVKSEAAMLAGPATDPEAWSWRKIARAKREGLLLSALEDDDPHHPRTVLGGWERLVREEYDQPTSLEWTLSRCVDYLTGKLTDLNRDSGQDLPQLAKETKRCRTHLVAVLHDQGQGDPAGVGCFDCGGSLERRLTDRVKHTSDPRRDTGGFEDHWTCTDCRRRYSYAEYNFALRAALEEKTA